MHDSAIALTLLGITTLTGFYLGRVVGKVKLPSLLGFMIIGIAFGQSGFGYLNHHILESLEFLQAVVLGLIAFGIGLELNFAVLRKLGIGLVLIIFGSSFAALVIVVALVYFITGDWPTALIFGAMAPATAPAGTVAVVEEMKAKGTMTKALYAVVGFDDGLAIVIFGFAFAIAKSLLLKGAGQATTGIGATLLLPFIEIGGSVLLGFVAGFLLLLMVSRAKQPHEHVILVMGFVLLMTGLSQMWHLSLIMTNLVVGMALANGRSFRLPHRVMGSIKGYFPLFFIWFFGLAGAHLDIKQLPALGWLGAAYIVGRSLGKVFGAMWGAWQGGMEEKIQKWLGLGTLPQAGVAIGLALIVKQEFAKLGIVKADEIGAAIITTVTATSVFFEIVGPIFTRIALEKAGECNVEKEA